MSNFEKEQTAKMQTFEKFTTPSEAIEKLTLLAVDLIQGADLSEADKKIIADCVMDYIQLKTKQIEAGKSSGKKRGVKPHPTTIWRDRKKKEKEEKRKADREEI